MTDKERILALRDYTRLNLKRMAEEARVGTVQTLYDIKNGKHGISREVAARLHARWPELSLLWLHTGEGDMLMSESTAPAEPDTDRVPLLPVSAFAGSIQAFTNDGVRLNQCENIFSPTRGAELALTVSGDSMEPQLQDGSIIFIKKINEESFIPWGHTLVLDTETGAFIKDVYPADTADKLIARSKNPKYPDMQIPKKSIFGVYRVLNAIKSFGLM